MLIVFRKYQHNRVATVPLYLSNVKKGTFIPLNKGILKGIERYAKGIMSIPFFFNIKVFWLFH